MKLKNFSISTRLGASFGLLVLITTVLGIFAQIEMLKLIGLTEQMYNHPFAVSNAVRDINTNIYAMYSDMKDVALSENIEQMEAASELVDEHERNVYEDFEVVFDRFLGDISEVEHFYQAFEDWKAIRDSVIELRRQGKVTEAVQITKDKGARHVEFLTGEIQALIDFANTKAEDFFNDAQWQENQSLILMLIILISLVIIGIIVSVLIARSIILPLKTIADRIQDISQGYLKHEVTFHSKDEIGQLADSFRELQTDLQQKAKAAEQIAALDFSTDIHPRSEKDELGKSFHAMTTSLRNTTKELIESEEKLKRFMESTTEGFVLYDSKLNLELINEASLKMMNRERKNIIGKNILEIIPGLKNTDKFDIFTRVLKTGEPVTLEDTFFLLGKEEAYYRINAFKVGSSLGFSFSDITEIKKAEEAKKKLEEQLLHVQKMESIGRLAGGIAHDFNNILGSIMGFSEVLQMKFPDRSSVEGKAADAIIRGVERAADLTKQLLGFARGGKYEPKPLNMNQVIRDTIKMSEKIFEKNIEVKLDFADNLKYIEADEHQMDQVLTNLIINAKDAMPAGGEILFKTENVFLSNEYVNKYPEFKAGNYVKISIIDTGTGMPKDIKDKIFEPFFSTKGIGKGTGLGLATVYGIVKNHGGHITVYSEPGVGTTFTIYMPVTKKSTEG
ncbi:ATP-binding protein [candidate division KSB1 bacterium]